MLSRFAFLSLLAVAVTAGQAFGQASTSTPSTLDDIRIDFTNNLSADGFFFTPVWFAFQDGNTPSVGPVFDQFNVGEAANSLLANTTTNNGVTQGAIEALAEDGFFSGLVEAFNNSGVPGNRQGVVLGPEGFGGAPVIDPGETGTAFITPRNRANYQYLTLASMLIPSNDVFIGNDLPEQWKVFNDDGSLADPDGDGLVVFEIFASDLFDAGTEVNNGDGAAFSTNGGTAVDENGVVSSVEAADLASLLNIGTPAGTTISQADIDALFNGDPIATITVSVVPEPTSALLIGLGAVGALLRRKRA